MVKGHGEGMFAGDTLACRVFPTRSTANVHRALSTNSQTWRYVWEIRHIGCVLSETLKAQEIEIKNVHYLCARYGYIWVSKKG
jgi:hypothetical protein